MRFRGRRRSCYRLGAPLNPKPFWHQLFDSASVEKVSCEIDLTKEVAKLVLVPLFLVPMYLFGPYTYTKIHQSPDSIDHRLHSRAIVTTAAVAS